MTLILALCVGVWVLGTVMGVSHRQRLAIVATLWGVSGLAVGLLPEGNGLRQIAGNDLRVWAGLSVLVGLGIGYFWLLQLLTSRKGPAQVIVSDVKFSAEEIDRYARHIMLREIGGPGQGKLKKARVLVVGAGGLGSPALLYLAAAGVGTLGVVDDDVVEASNLQRQIIHKDQSIGMPKVQSAMQAVAALNPFVTVLPYQRRFDPQLIDLIHEFDIVLDGSDNFDTRYLVNRETARAGKPLISGAITQWEGQLSLFDPKHGTPCYECVFPNRPAIGMVPTCAEVGAAAPLPGVIGAMMAMEAVKHITGAGETLRGRLLIHDALYAETRVIEIARRADCPVCGART